MKRALYQIVMYLAYLHDGILRWNDRFEMHFSDKELHFLVIGVFGMAVYLVMHPLFDALARKGRTSAITWIYTFTVLVGFTLAIEIGQHITGTGQMELADILYGLAGFAGLYIVYALLRRFFRR